MLHLSIDLETLGTNIDSQIIQIGACVFNPRTDDIHSSLFSTKIRLDQDVNINATPGTLKFWAQQVAENPAMLDVLDTSVGHPMTDALALLSEYCKEYEIEAVWANGTKFDIGMLEYQYKLNNMQVPWEFNADRCMRTVRALNPEHARCVAKANEYSTPGLGAHDAITDAVWQARYIQLALRSMHQQGLK